MESNELAPYFKDGALYLPEKAIELLSKSGIDPSVLEAARMGMALDNTDEIASISKAMEELLSNLSSS